MEGDLVEEIEEIIAEEIAHFLAWSKWSDLFSYFLSTHLLFSKIYVIVKFRIFNNFNFYHFLEICKITLFGNLIYFLINKLF